MKKFKKKKDPIRMKITKYRAFTTEASMLGPSS